MSGLTYTEKVLELMRRPKNLGEIKKADGVATVGNRACGDIMKLYIKVEKKNEKEYLKDIKFQTLGCPAAIATSSILTQMAKGQTLKKALLIDNQQIVKELGGLPQTKHHCSVLAAEALEKAVGNYRKKNKK